MPFFVIGLLETKMCIMSRVKIFNFTEAIQRLSERGGYISFVENETMPRYSNENIEVIYIHEDGRLLNGKKTIKGDFLKGDGNVAMFSQNQATSFYTHHPMPKQIIESIYNVGEDLYVPKNAASQEVIYNSQLNTLVGIGYKEVFKQLTLISENIKFGREMVDLSWVLLAVLKTSLLSQNARNAKGNSNKKPLYKKKDQLLEELCEFCNKTKGYNVAYGHAEEDNLPHPIIYLDLPNCEQISFCAKLPFKMEEYDGKWDGNRASVLPKLERCIFRSGLYELFDIKS